MYLKKEKIQLARKAKFMSSTNSSEKYTMHSKSDNIEFITDSDTYDIIQ